MSIVIDEREEALLKMKYPLLFDCGDLKKPRNVDKVYQFYNERLIAHIPTLTSTLCIAYVGFLKTCQHFTLTPTSPKIERVWNQTFCNIIRKFHEYVILNEILNPYLVRHGYMPIEDINEMLDDRLTSFKVIKIQ